MPWERLETTSYWWVYGASFLLIALWESHRPRRDLKMRAERRWREHGLVLVISTLLMTALYRVSPVLLAVRLSGSAIGLLNHVHLPFSVKCVSAVIVLDLTRYVVHRGFHAADWLWRFHQVHHSDPDFDVSTGARVHPVEVLITQGATLIVVAAWGAPAASVLFFELATSLLSCFGHANIRLRDGIETPLRSLLVTPDMHRIHHSERGSEQRCNFGDVFPWWDRLFGTYLEEPVGGQDGLVVGLKEFQDDGSLGLLFMLLLPFRRNRPASTVSAR
jgi:sterol desaturase/sphingolipid hydroxylase (fatty acid hydroxylase superfamily)